MNSLIKLNNQRKDAFFPKFPSLFDDFFTRDVFNVPVRRDFNANTTPSVNVKETDKSFELEVAAPGMDKKNFKVELEHNTLIISAQTENVSEEKDENSKYSRKEFNYASFKRAFHLPENTVNEEEITANYTNGILHVTLPKKENVKTTVSREISIA